MDVVLLLTKGHLSNKDRIVWQKGRPSQRGTIVHHIRRNMWNSTNHDLCIYVLFSALQYVNFAFYLRLLEDLKL